jgi:hypothetical protein
MCFKYATKYVLAYQALASDVKRSETEVIWEQDAEGNIWTKEELNDTRLEKTTKLGAS